MEVPVTQVSLLKVLGQDAQSPRWTEFANKYASTIDGFLYKYFPMVDKEEVVNETLLALVKKLPLYCYDPDKTGHFRNYLIGIVRYMAIAQLKRFRRESELQEKLTTEAEFSWEYQKESYSVDLRDWRREASEAALAQFRADPKIATRDKEIFRRVVLCGESADEAAAIFNIERNNVYQIKSRMCEKLRELVEQYKTVCDG